MNGRRIAAAGLVALAVVTPLERAAAGSAVSVGESIYLRGVLGSGAPLEGKREGSAALAASERSGIVMGLAKRGTGAKRPLLLKGWAQIT